jgi:ribosome modulation factor
MKRQKRDRLSRAHSKGFTAGTLGRSYEACPFQQLDTREEWLCGWREAREKIAHGYQYT